MFCLDLAWTWTRHGLETIYTAQPSTQCSNFPAQNNFSSMNGEEQTQERLGKVYTVSRCLLFHLSTSALLDISSCVDKVSAQPTLASTKFRPTIAGRLQVGTVIKIVFIRRGPHTGCGHLISALHLLISHGPAAPSCSLSPAPVFV